MHLHGKAAVAPTLPATAGPQANHALSGLRLELRTGMADMGAVRDACTRQFLSADSPIGVTLTGMPRRLAHGVSGVDGGFAGEPGAR
jgi:hypothetical protein